MSKLIPSPSARQPARQVWSMEHFVKERALALSFALEKATQSSYSSALQSYLHFCRLHGFPVDPTTETLSFFTVWLSHHIDPKSVGNYLSGICSELEPLFPDVRKNRRSPLVSNVLAGCKKQFGGKETNRKDPVSIDDITRVIAAYPTPSHDDSLFLAIITCGFFGLHRLGELTDKDQVKLREPRKVIRRASVKVKDDTFSYWLPMHKADRFWQGGKVMIVSRSGPANPLPLFRRYLTSRDRKFPLHQALFLTSRGRVPTRSWFLRRFFRFFSHSFGGHSLRAGGATFFALLGYDNETIQRLARWASEAFQIYVRKNPVLLYALIQSGAAIRNIPRA